MKENFKVGDQLRMLKKGEQNDVYKEIGRGFVSRIANDDWVFYIDRESTSPIEELVPVFSHMTKIVKG